MAPAQAKPFRPNEALGAAIDGTDRGGVDRILTRHNVAAMKRAGLRSLSYRLRTELGIEAWHWNPRGSWSDPAHRQGYWTSSATVGKPINLSWGYRLPRRGDTVDQANDQGYSRLTDGDRSTIWKSNPYLDPKSVHDGVAHPQWLVVRFARAQRIDTGFIDWGTPFATRYEVQYWTGASEDDGDGRWVTFPSGRIAHGRGGRVELRLAKHAIATTHVRVLLEAGSGTGPAGSGDWRDRAGYAVREVAFGLRRTDGSFADAVTHAPSHTKQTFTHVSSTDPWHRAADRDPDLEQPGIDRIFASGLTFGQPAMLATGLLYDTPANIRSELRYLARRHYRVGRVELGEEPDG
ncbi:MAG TPA: discoidin domain-containing protein, partial [Croceibacterium sp.]|nr:discoidin domain-containing protein [Croceibacterium sp.]